MLKQIIRLNNLLCDTFCSVFIRFTHENNYSEVVTNRLETFLNSRKFSRVLEVGGIDRPILGKAPEWVFDGIDIEYSPRMDEIYDHVVIRSIEEPLTESYDLIYSMTLLEHVADNSRSIPSIYRGLNPGGCTVHYVPSKNHPYSILLQILGPLLGAKLVHILCPESRGRSGYTTFFNKCSPNEMKTIFHESGFVNIEIIPFYRVSYFRFLFPLFLTILCWENVCKYFKFRQLCSGFILAASKPESAAPSELTPQYLENSL